jgi:hypothetical protein
MLEVYISFSYGAIEVCEKGRSAPLDSCARHPCLDGFMSFFLSLEVDTNIGYGAAGDLRNGECRIKVMFALEPMSVSLMSTCS